MVQNRLNTMVVGPLWVVQLWLYAYFPELAPSFSDTYEIALKSPATIHGPCMS